MIALAIALPLRAQFPTQRSPFITVAMSAGYPLPTTAFGDPIASSAFVTIFGSALSDQSYEASSPPWPKTLGQTTVTVCDPANNCVSPQLTYVSPAQINVLLPVIAITANAASVCAAAGVPLFVGTSQIQVAVTCASISVRVGALQSNILVVPVKAYYPDIFVAGFDCWVGTDPFGSPEIPCGLANSEFGFSAATRGAVTDLSGKLIYSKNPAQAGQYYTIWLTGVALAAPTEPFPFVSVLVGQTFLAPLYAGASQFPGLIQVNFQMPGVASSSSAPCSSKSDVPIAVVQGNEPMSVLEGEVSMWLPVCN